MPDSEVTREIELETELTECPECDYAMGFHVVLKRPAEARHMSILLKCPNCGAVYDVGWRRLHNTE